jgi:uncharacterized membrane protein YjgN (DUF898 family)
MPEKFMRMKHRPVNEKQPGGAMTSDFNSRSNDFADRFSGPLQAQDQAQFAATGQLAENDLVHTPKQAFAAFSGRGVELFGIMIVNFIFSILTLGIYHFWGKVRVRKYLWRHSAILGSPLEYTGNGMELFISFLIVFVVLLLYSLIMSFTLILAFLSIPALFWAIYFAMYRSIRFRLTRTRWRGIYANLPGSAVNFAKTVTLLSLANLLCLGLLTPYITARLYRLVLNDVYWGSMKFSFNGLAKSLYKSFFLGMGASVLILILFAGFGYSYFEALFPSEELAEIFIAEYAALIVLSFIFAFVSMITLAFFYYAACKTKWFYDHLSLPGVRFTCGLPVSAFISLYITNGLLLIFTLGFGYAWTVTRTIHRLAVAAVYHGHVDEEAIGQNTQSVPKRGDGLLDALDLDVAF